MIMSQQTNATVRAQRIYADEWRYHVTKVTPDGLTQDQLLAFRTMQYLRWLWMIQLTMLIITLVGIVLGIVLTVYVTNQPDPTEYVSPY
jgi:hypothetical protein